MKQRVLELWVGFFVLIGIAALVFLAFNVAAGSIQSSPKSGYTLSASFSDIGGLKAKAPVKAAGVLVGRVSDIRLDPKTYEAKVTLQMDGQYQFSEDVSAEILTSGLLGEQYIGLQQGGDEEMLKNGGVITVTSSALVLEQLIGKFMTGFAEKNSGESH